MKKGVSSVMSIILLVVVGTSLSGVAYHTYTSMTKDIISVQEKQIIGELELEESKVRIEKVGYCSVNIRNVGDNDIDVSSLEVYINDKHFKIPTTENILEKNENIRIKITRDMLSDLEADISLKVGGKVNDIGRIICPIPVNGTLRKNNCKSDEVCVIAFSALNNSHVEDCSEGNYLYKLCVDNINNVTITSSDCSDEEGSLITMSGNTNAQVEEYHLPITGFATKKNVCINSSLGDVNCIYGNCSSSYYNPLFSISNLTISESANAHVGDKEHYNKVVCCRIQ